MNITEELISLIYERANQYALTKYGNAPDTIEIFEDGSIGARFVTYCYGDRDEEMYIITAENLTEDLDVVAKERKILEEAERIKTAAYHKEQEKIRNAREKERRKQDYLKLKKEFEL
jgi:hypothetical protein